METKMPSSPKYPWRFPRRSSALIGAALLASIGACGPGEFPESDAAVSPYSVTLDVTPDGELEEGKELTFNLSVFHEGDLLTDIMPELEFVGPEVGSIELMAGAEPGTFVGTHTFGAEGTYTVHVHFNAEGADQELEVILVIRAPDGHQH